MKLLKPLVVLDLETTGVWIEKDRIIEIALIRKEPDGTVKEYCHKVNPGIPIPKEVTELTGISDDDVKDAPKFKSIAKEVLEFIGDSDLCGFNAARFDIPLLCREMSEVGLELSLKNRDIVDVQKIYHYHEKRDLTAAYKFYCDKGLEGAHSALVDTQATLEILEKQVDQYGDESKEIKPMLEFDYKKNSFFYDKDRKFRWWNGHLYMMFGKYARKEPLEAIARKDPGYLEWIMSKDFSSDVKYLVENALNGVFPKEGESADN